MPIAIRTSPASIVRSGLGVTSKLPSGERSAMITAPVVLRIRSWRIVRPVCGPSGVTSISSSRRSGPAKDEISSRNAATCGLSASFAISVPAAAYGCTTRLAPASSSFRSASRVDARATIIRSSRCDRAESVM